MPSLRRMSASARWRALKTWRMSLATSWRMETLGT
jgi:hypothetical protein